MKNMMKGFWGGGSKAKGSLEGLVNFWCSLFLFIDVYSFGVFLWWN